MYASLIIPSYNVCERLYYNLLSLNYQDCGFEKFEVIVIDNGSIDNTCGMLLNIDVKYKLEVIHLDKNMGRAFARNTGIKKSKGEILIFHDSDMIAFNDYVRKHLLYQKDKAKVVCGSNCDRIYTHYYKDIKINFDNNYKNPLYKLKYGNNGEKLKDKHILITKNEIINGNYKKYIFKLDDKTKEFDEIAYMYGENLKNYNFPWRFFVTNNCSARKDDILEIGCFDERFIGWGCEDLDLGYRMYLKGRPFVVKRDIRSVHQEHPREIKNDCRKNIFNFTRKYNSSDILLFYFGIYVGINKENFNSIIHELKIIEETFPKSVIPLLFNKMLIKLRDCIDKDIDIKRKKATNKNIISIEGFDTHIILNELNILRNIGIIKIAHAFKLLLKEIYGIRL